MIGWKALLLAVPLALAGGWIIRTATAQVAARRAELASLDAQGRAEGDSFVRTLRGSHAERELLLLTARQEAVVRLASARRNQLLGLLLVLAGLLAYAVVRVLQRVAAELDEDRRLLHGAPPRPSDR